MRRRHNLKDSEVMRSELILHVYLVKYYNYRAIGIGDHPGKGNSQAKMGVTDASMWPQSKLVTTRA